MDGRRILAVLITGTFSGLTGVVVGHSMSPYVGTYGGGLDYWLADPERYGPWLIVGFAVGILGSLAFHLLASQPLK
jgi:hypothetical protein